MATAAAAVALMSDVALACPDGDIAANAAVNASMDVFVNSFTIGPLPAYLRITLNSASLLRLVLICNSKSAYLIEAASPLI